MLHAQDLINHLKQQGFQIEGTAISSSLCGNQSEITEASNNNYFTTLPFIKGFSKVPTCKICHKKCASDEILNEHLSSHHTTEEIGITPDVQENDASPTDDQMCTRYEIFDGDFVSSKENPDSSFYLVLKIDNFFDTLSCKRARGRKIRKAETKPRKVYSRVKVEGVVEEKKPKNPKTLLVGPFKCVQCDGEYETCCNYSKHFHAEHSKRKTQIYKCQICEKKFNLGVHFMASATETCGEGEGDLLQHTQPEHNRSRLTCDFGGCDKTFTSQAALNQHLKLHSGIRPFACSVESCSKTFTQKSGLEQHMRIHASQKPYVCVVCNVAFRQSSHLAQHLRIHSNVHPYACTYCPRKFKQSSHLSRHMRTAHLEIDMFRNKNGFET